MGLISALAIAGGLAGGFLLGRRGNKDKSKIGETTGQATARGETPAEQVAKTAPVSTTESQSANISEAAAIAARTRRRAGAGHAGRVTLSGSTTSTAAPSKPRTLLGY